MSRADVTSKVKIGILTFHRSINYGAYMQCYSLSRKLQKDFPQATVEVIDYITETAYKRYVPRMFSFVFGPKGKRNKPIEIVKRIGKVILRPKQMSYKRNLYNAFQNNVSLLPLSCEKVISNNIIQFEKIYADKYDIIVVGSDAVWEFLTYPFPNVYFMCNKISKYCVSYAASADRMHYSLIDDEQRKIIAKAMQNFDYIGVRDVSTENLLKAIDDTIKFEHNCDPSALVDLSALNAERESVKKKLLQQGICMDKPMIGVMAGAAVTHFVKKEYGETHQVISLFNLNPEADANLDDLTPLEWAIVFSFFDVTFTRYFHGTWFSMMNLTPPIIIDDWTQVDNLHDTKLLDLAKRLNLMDSYFRLSEFETDEGKKKIKVAASSKIKYPRKSEIALSISKEATGYEGFRDEIRCICKKLEVERGVHFEQI